MLNYVPGIDKSLLGIYFNWSANALVPVNGPAADIFLREHRETVYAVALQLAQMIVYTPRTVYRGLLLRSPATMVCPQPGHTGQASFPM